MPLIKKRVSNCHMAHLWLIKNEPIKLNCFYVVHQRKVFIACTGPYSLVADAHALSHYGLCLCHGSEGAKETAGMMKNQKSTEGTRTRR